MNPDKTTTTTNSCLDSHKCLKKINPPKKTLKQPPRKLFNENKYYKYGV